MEVHIVYAHPTHGSFTGAILQAFTAGLTEAGHTFTISDLYAMGFDPILSATEYQRESTGDCDTPVPDDVAAEQAKLLAADAWAFVYPMWWNDCPAIMKGWFDRVWTYGWAYLNPEPVQVRKAVVLCAAGHTRDELTATGKMQAAETTMLVDRIFDRAAEREFHLFGGSETTPPEEWLDVKARHLENAQLVGRSI